MFDQRKGVAGSKIIPKAMLGESLLAEIEPVLIAQGIRQRHPIARAHLVAIRNWLGRYLPSGDLSARETVRGYREAYYHLREVGAWRQALDVLRVSLKVQKQVAYRRWDRFQQELVGEGDSGDG